MPPLPPLAPPLLPPPLLLMPLPPLVLSLLLLLPSRLPLSLFEQVTRTVSSGVSAHINEQVVVTGFHPDDEIVAKRSPVPVVQVFLDSPDLLVDGGSLSDASGFL